MTAACASPCAATSAFLPRRSAACTCAPARASPASPPSACVRCRSRSASRTGTSSTSPASARRSTRRCSAVPILRGGITAGVLVLQRGVERAFSDGEVVLATALAAVINHAIERGQERERRQARSSRSPRGAPVGAIDRRRRRDGPRRAAADAVGAVRQRDRASRPRPERSRRRSSACRRSCARRRRARTTPPRASCAACR